MAGGTFTQMNKVRPGAYIDIVAPQKTIPSADSARGVVLFVGGGALGWGANGIIPLNAASNFKKLLGIDPNDAPIDTDATSTGAVVQIDAKVASMLSGLREALKAARSVLFYNVNSGTKATLKEGTLPWTFAAKYEGTRGNDLKVAVTKDAIDQTKTIVTVYFGSQVVDKQSVKSASALQSDDYIDVAVTDAAKADDGKALLDAIVLGSTNSLTGGLTDAAQDVDTDALIEAMEVETFNTVTAAGQADDARIHQLIATTVERLRDEEGQKVVGVIPDGAGVDADNEGLIVVANGVVLANGTALTVSQTCGWVAAAEASANVNESLTYREYPEAVDVTKRFNNEDTISALQAGKFLFTVRRNGAVVVEQDINSLHTFGTDKNQAETKNQVMRVLDTIAINTKDTFETSFIGKVVNDAIGRDLFKGNRMEYLATLANARAIDPITADDLSIEQGPEVDQVVVKLAIKPNDSMEKLYMTVTI